MRYFPHFVAALFGLIAPSIASASCGDPGSSPSIAGRSFAGTHQWDGDPRVKEAIVFNSDCTLTSAEAKEMLGSATWTQSGQVVTMIYNNYTTFTGTFNGDEYSGTMRNSDWSGQFEYFPMPKSELRLFLWADLDQTCGPAKIPNSAAGSSLAGSVEWADQTSAKLAFRLKPDCTGVVVGDTRSKVFWGQADGAVLISVGDEAAIYVARWSDRGMSGKAKRKDGVTGTFILERLDW